MNQSLKSKIFDIFDVYYNEESTDKAILRELNRRGKTNDPRKIIEIIFLLVDEIDKLKKTSKK